MKRKQSIPFLMLIVGAVAAVPVSWSAGGVTTDMSRKVTLCHIPPGNPDSAHTIAVGQAAVAAHLAHGDYLGECRPACPVGASSPVPKTGQTACWDSLGSVINCAGTGQDGEYQEGASTDPRFTDNFDGTVTDNLTGLIWLTNPNCFIAPRSWERALSDANTLADGACGLMDGSAAGAWRLPNVKELQSLIDFGQYNPALPVGHPFSGVHSNFYWSSTSYGSSLDFPAHAWYVRLYNGDVLSDDKASTHYVWPVRDEQ